MMSRPWWCISLILTCAALHERSDSPQAGHAGAGRLMRLEDGIMLEPREDPVPQVEAQDLLFTARSHLGSSLLDVEEIRRLNERHNETKAPRYRDAKPHKHKDEAGDGAPTFPGAPKERSVSDIEGEMEIRCDNPSDIYLSVEALTKVQQVIANIARVEKNAVTVYFKKPESLLDARGRHHQPFVEEVLSSVSKFVRETSIFVEFYITYPKGTDPDNINKRISNADKSKLSLNLGNSFQELELIPSADKVSVVVFLSHEEDKTLEEYPHRRKSSASGTAVGTLLLYVVSILTFGLAVHTP
mmetsp:Transcript_91016/g.167125  ORF Transcript_91016/g.167125 Transcript_91016/m.167125 type:complete len:300 (-) Transcript_91016:19-918(-)